MAIASEPCQCEGSSDCSSNWTLARQCGFCMNILNILNIPYQHFYALVGAWLTVKAKTTATNKTKQHSRSSDKLAVYAEKQIETMNEGMNKRANKDMQCNWQLKEATAATIALLPSAMYMYLCIHVLPPRTLLSKSGFQQAAMDEVRAYGLYLAKLSMCRM